MPKVERSSADAARDRLLAIDQYQKKLDREERKARQLSADDRDTLNTTFAAVRTEFADLDGMHSPARTRTSPTHTRTSPPHAKPLTPSCTPNRRKLTRTYASAAILKSASLLDDDDDQNAFSPSLLNPSSSLRDSSDDQDPFSGDTGTNLAPPLLLNSGHPCSPPPARLTQQELDAFRDDETIRASGRSPIKAMRGLLADEDGDDSDAESTFSFHPDAPTHGRARRTSRLFGYADADDDTYSYTQDMRPTSSLSFLDDEEEGGMQYATFEAADDAEEGDEDEQDDAAERAIQRALALRGMMFTGVSGDDNDDEDE